EKQAEAAMTAERRKKSGLPGAREGPATPASEAQARAYLRLRQLYEISKLLTSFESVEETITAIVGLVGEALSLRSVIFILESVGPPRTIIWKANAESEERLREAKAHARGSYSYLVRSGVDLDAVAARPLPGPLRNEVRIEAEGATSFVVLPLVVDHRPIFGTLQFETAPRLDELDLVFVNAVVNQLAVALDRDGRDRHGGGDRLRPQRRNARHDARLLGADRVAGPAHRVGHRGVP